MGVRLTASGTARLDAAVISLYDAEIDAIERIMDEMGAPRDDDAGEPIPPRLRVRWFVDQHLDHMGTHPAPADGSA